MVVELFRKTVPTNPSSGFSPRDNASRSARGFSADAQLKHQSGPSPRSAPEVPVQRMFTKDMLPSLPPEVLRSPRSEIWRSQPPTARAEVPNPRTGYYAGCVTANANAPVPRELPPTRVPELYQVRQSEPVRPAKGKYNAAWDAENEVWHVTIFPAAQPSDRGQIGYLRDCLNKMLAAEKAQASRITLGAPRRVPLLAFPSGPWVSAVSM